MQNVWPSRSTYLFWHRIIRYSSLSKNSKMKYSYHRHLHNHHQFQRVKQQVYQSKLFHLCGTMSNLRTVRNYSYINYESEDEDVGFLNESGIDFEDDTNLSKNMLAGLRNIVYPDSKDNICIQLTEAASIQDVFTVIEKQGKNLTVEQATQAVVSLWDVQKIYSKDRMTFPQSRNIEIADFLNNVVNHEMFSRMIHHLQAHSEDLDNDSITCLLLFLDRLGIRDSSPLMQKLILLSISRMKDFRLSALSRLSVYLRHRGLGKYYLQAMVVSFISRKLNELSFVIETLEDLKLLTICVNSNENVMSESLYKEYEELVSKFMEQNKFKSCDARTLLKVINVLDYRYKRRTCNTLQRDIMLLMSEKVPTLMPTELFVLHSYFQNILEPRELTYRIQERAVSLLEQCKTPSMKIKILFCMISYTVPQNRSQLEEIILECFDEEAFLDVQFIIFKCLRTLKSCNLKLCNAYWSKAFRSVENEIRNTKELHLGMEESLRKKVYKSYMFFNNNLGGTYRNAKIEKSFSDLFLKDLRSEVAMIPYKVAGMSSFVIGYNRDNKLPDDIVAKLLKLGPQFNLLDISMLSRGVQISLGFKNRDMKRGYIKQITDICHNLNSCTETCLKTASSLEDVCRLTQGYLNRGGSPGTFLFEALIEKQKEFIGDLNSRLITYITGFFLHSKYTSSEILESIAQYIIDNQEYILIDTLARFLSCVYLLGYHLTCSEKFFTACQNIFLQNYKNLTGLIFLQVNIALCFYGYLTPEAIRAVFNISYLDQLDDEIEKCYSKASYPYKVRHSLMELNRAVCIDHPEVKVPWFHQKYCEELMETVTVPNTEFHSEVHQALFQLVGGPEVVRSNVRTPYFYLVDFEFILNEDQKPVPISEYTNRATESKDMRIENKPGYKRVAVLLRKEKNYSVNNRTLLGRHQMECHHLEVLGYQVVEVSPFMWYSMAIATPADRVKYLKTLIYPQV